MEPDIVACFDSIVDALIVVERSIVDASRTHSDLIEQLISALEGLAPRTQASLDHWTN